MTNSGRGRTRRYRAKALLVASSCLAAVACTGDYSTTPTTEAAQPQPTTTAPFVRPTLPEGQPEAPGGDPELVIDLGGTLAITVEHLVVTASPDGEQVELVDGGPQGIASQPVWSKDGSKLAWTHVGPEGESVGIRDEEDEIQYSTAIGGAPYYLQWDEGGNQLAYLRPTPTPEPGTDEGQNPDGAFDPGAGAVEAGIVFPGEPVLPISSGAPFFLSWAPNGEELIALRNESQLLHLSPAQGIVAIEDGDGPYTLPVWSSNTTLIVSDEDSIDELNVVSGDRRELAQVAGRVRFTLSPDKTRLAYSPAEDGLVPGGNDQLIVVDLESGAERIVTEGFLLAWEWSLDSQTLAWLAPAPIDEIEFAATQRSKFVWSFWTNGVVENGIPYLPSEIDARFYLPFFEQFVQSHHRWSPQSNAFAFAGTIEGVTGIWIQVLGFAEYPVFITPGDAVTWGPADPSGGSGSKL